MTNKTRSINSRKPRSLIITDLDGDSVEFNHAGNSVLVSSKSEVALIGYGADLRALRDFVDALPCAAFKDPTPPAPPQPEEPEAYGAVVSVGTSGQTYIRTSRGNVTRSRVWQMGGSSNVNVPPITWATLCERGPVEVKHPGWDED